jgi:MFS transporter, DHA1 family, inner membrane transport protein
LTTSSAHPSGTSALWVLLFGNLIAGTGVLLPAGLLNDFAADFAISPARAGLLLFVGGLVVGIGAPLLAWATSGIDRRVLLTLSLVLYAAGHAASAVITNYELLLAVRAVTMIAAAIYTPQAAATVGLLVPPERRGSAIAFIFIGWSLASVVGIPLGSWLGAVIGWRTTFLCMAGFAAVGAITVWLALPRGLKVQPLLLSSWGVVFTNPVLLLVLVVTLLSMSGQFTLFAYVAPVLKLAYGAGPEAIAVTFAIVGGVGVAGNYAASLTANRFGLDRSILLSLGLIAAGLAIIALTFGSFYAFIAGGALWGLGSFASNSLQQSRLVAIAPALASATVALNTSVVYLGQSIGSSAGGAVIAKAPSPLMAWIGTAFLVAAMALSVVASRIAKPPT